MRPHRLLDRQLRKLGLSAEAPPASCEAWSALLDRISATYAESDEDRYLLERSLSISSCEMREMSQALLVELERRVAERTQELETALRELERARAAAEEGTRAKSRFLASVSHEIRTPLNAIIGISELLQKTPLSESQREYVGTLHTASETLLALVSQTLDFSKIEAGRLELETTRIDLQTCLDQALDLVASKAKAKGLELRCSVGGDVPRRIVSDPTRLRQILVNLLDNGVKFTAQGHVAVTVEWQADGYAAGFLLLTVTDTGVGIPAGRLGSIFGPFSQVDTTTTRAYGGTGLGLAIVERLCELMGGSVTAESEEGRGSIFRVRIRVGLAPESLTPIEPFPARPPALAATAPQSLRILVAEDNPVNQLLAVRMLESLGYASPLLATDGEEVLDVLRREPCDVVLMDLHMPRMDGIETSLRIRDMFGEEARPAIVALTADALEESRAACLDAGMAGILTKPFRTDELRDCLARFQGRSQARAS
ncbi:MAG TPA: ATP-binding protein [Thermoanaerobaculia bacterium]|nr:ATP-binding protein [Thermoanaerobaculia bacterium]